MNLSKRDIIKRYVDQIEKENPQGVYKKCLGEIAGIGLQSIDIESAGQVLKDYLYTWGKMGRVVGQNISWQSSLTREIRRKSDMLEGFRHKELENEALSGCEENIKKCYDSFQKIVWQVAAAKVLHLLCPNFFPPWENAIAKSYRRVVSKNRNIEDFSADDYYRFMEWIQRFIKEHSKTLSELADYYGKTKVRIVDECLLYAVRNPFSHIL